MRTLIVLAAVAAMVMPSVASAQRRVPNLAGGWVLRDSLPTPPAPARDTAAAADSAAQDTAGGMRGDSAGRRGPMGPRGGPGPRRNPRDLQQVQRLMGMSQPVRAFTIAQTDSSVTVTNEDGFSYTVFLDGRKTTLPLDDSVSVEAQAKWEDGVLVIEYRPTGGGKLTEWYHLADSRRYLRLEVAVEHKAMFRRFWQARMYRRSETTGS
jgi:hypothetical protein